MKKKEKPIKLPRNLLLPLSMVGLICSLYALPHQTMMRIFYIVGISLVVDMLYLQVVSRKIHLKVEAAEECIRKGEEMTLRINLQNQAILPSPYIYVFLKETYRITSDPVSCLCVTLGGKSEENFELRYKAKWSGQEQLEVEQVVIVDFFEMLRKKIDFSWQHKMKVLPNCEPMKEEKHSISYIPQKNREKFMNQLKKDNEGEISYELAPYQQGQPEKQIHWKLVAQRDIYMIRAREVVKDKKQTSLVILDPVIGVKQDKERIYPGLLATTRYRNKRTYEERLAKLEDYRLCACISYINELISQKEEVIFRYLLDNKWQQMTIRQKSDLQQLSQVIGQAFCERNMLEGERLPSEESKQYERICVLSASVDHEVIEYVNERTSVLLLALQSQPLKYKGNRYAYISEAYEIKSCL